MHKLTREKDVVEKRLAPIAIALIKVIGGQLLAGAAKIAVDATKAHLEVEKADFNNFDDVGRCHVFLNFADNSP